MNNVLFGAFQLFNSLKSLNKSEKNETNKKLLSWKFVWSTYLVQKWIQSQFNWRQEKKKIINKPKFLINMLQSKEKEEIELLNSKDA